QESSNTGTQRRCARARSRLASRKERERNAAERHRTWARLNRTQEVGGSSPPSSIPERPVLEPSLGSGTASRVVAAGLGTKQESSTTATVARLVCQFAPTRA